MRDYVAVVAHENNRVAKMMDFDSLAEAQAHASTHGGFAASTPQAPVKDWYVDGSTLSVSTPPGTEEQVIAERGRRLQLGFDYDFQDARGVHRIGTTESDMKGWDEVTKKANAKIALGKSSETFPIFTDTGQVSVTALEWMQILEAADVAREPIWLGSFALLAMDPIPGDYEADSRWQPAS